MVKNKKNTKKSTTTTTTTKKPGGSVTTAETFDDFLNTLNTDDEDELEDEEEEEEEEDGSLQDDNESDDDEVEEEFTNRQGDEEEESTDNEDEGVEENGHAYDKEETGDDDDDESVDLNAELEKSLVNQGHEGDNTTDDEDEHDQEENNDNEQNPADDDDNVDYFMRDKDPDDENTQETDEVGFKESLAGLAESDPDFFAYLKENDADLLEFGDEDDDEDSENDDDDKDDDAEGAVHKPQSRLEVASDSEAESEEEAENLDKDSKEYQTKVSSYLKRRVVNLSVISYWETRLATTRDLTIFSQVLEAFDSAVQLILQDKDKSNSLEKKGSGSVGGGGSSMTKWKVEGSTNFNALMRLCLRSVFGWSVKYLNATNNETFASKIFTKNPYEVKKKNETRWMKLRPKLKSYMNSLVIFLRSMGNPEAITSVLRHCQIMSGFWALFTTKSYKLLRTLIHVWSTGEDSNRIAAFVTILRMCNYNKEFYLARVMKQMYIAFVSNSKFTSINSWASINFMRASLVELYLLNSSLAYSIAFPFVRQLAIHLRNATTAGTTPGGGKKGGGSGGDGGGNKSKSNKNNNNTSSKGGGKKSGGGSINPDGTFGSKKEASRIVYSWQYLHSLHLWAQLLGEAGAKGDTQLQLLVHPVVQVCLGTIKLIPTRKYIPLRFHILKILIELQDKTKLFIPILPLATEILHLTDFSYKTVAKLSVRPLNLNVCLKADPAETGYFKAVSEGIFDSILSVCSVIGTELAFPEIVLPSVLQLKSFLKNKCKNGEVARKFKTLVEKIEANSTFIKEKRSKAMEAGQISLNNEKSLQILRIEIQNSTPPITSFATDYFKMNRKKTAKLHRPSHVETREEKLIPKASSSNKKAKVIPKKLGNSMKSNVLFGDDDDDEDDDQQDQNGVNDDETGGGLTKFDLIDNDEENKLMSGKKKKNNNKRNKSTDNNDDEMEEMPKKKKTKKDKKKKKNLKSNVDDVQDQIVDFNFDDDDDDE